METKLAITLVVVIIVASSSYASVYEECRDELLGTEGCKECCETEFKYMSSYYVNITNGKHYRCDCERDWDWDVADCDVQHKTHDQCRTCCRENQRDLYSVETGIVCVCTSKNYENQIAAGIRPRVRPDHFG